jgi:WD40 repeat protein
MKFDRFDYLVWSILGILLIGIIGMAIYENTRGLYVTDVTPQPNESVSASSNVEVNFSQLVDAIDAGQFFEIEPEVEGQVQLQGNNLTFKPFGFLKPGEIYQIKIKAGLQGKDGKRLKEDQTWGFSVNSPSVVYIYPGTGERELWKKTVTPPEKAEKITDTGGNIWDFAVAKHAPEIAISVKNEQNGIDLWLISQSGEEPRLLVDCGLDRCYSPDWAPDGRRIAYSREIFDQLPPQGYAPSRIWLVDTSTTETKRLFADTQKLGFGPSWSPDGQYLASVDGQKGGIRIVEIQNGEELFLPTMLGRVGSWSPEGDKMIISDVEFVDGIPTSKVYLADIKTQEVINLSGFTNDRVMNIDVPVWSPDGEQLLFGARALEQGSGKQLWLSSIDGENIEQITSDEQISVMDYHWSPSGENVLIQSIKLGEPDAKPETWLWDLKEATFESLAENTSSPHWMP